VTDAARGAPLNDTIEIAGPERVPVSETVARYLLEDWLRPARTR
jgi:hypothetical protein